MKGWLCVMGEWPEEPWRVGKVTADLFSQKAYVLEIQSRHDAGNNAGMGTVSRTHGKSAVAAAHLGQTFPGNRETPKEAQAGLQGCFREPARFQEAG